MKKLEIMFYAFLLAVSCVKAGPEEETGPFVLGIDRSAATVQAKDAENPVLQVTSDGNWNSETPEWISVSPSSGSAGTTQVTLKVRPNIDTDGTIAAPRMATVFFFLGSSKQGSPLVRSVKIKQKGDLAKGKGEIQRVTISEFVDLADDETFYQLTGKITSLYDDEKGLFVVGDDTGSIYVDGISEDSFGNISESGGVLKAKGIETGCFITLNGVWRDYYGTPQVSDAWYVSHTAGEYMEIRAALAAEPGVRVVVRGSVSAVCGRGIILSDSSSSIFVAKEELDDLSAGDVVEVEALTAFESKSVRLAANKITKISSGEYSYPAALETGADELTNYANAETVPAEYVHLVGKLSVTGGEIFVRPVSCTGVVAKMYHAVQPLEPSAADNGKDIDMYAYTVSSSDEGAIDVIPVQWELSGSRAFTVKELLELEDGSACGAVTGYVMASSGEGFVLSDDFIHSIYVRTSSAPVPGTYVTLQNGSLASVSMSRVVEGAEISEEYKGKVSYPAAADVSESASGLEGFCPYILYEGIVTLSGSSYVLENAGSSASIELSSPKQEDLDILSVLEGKELRVYGYVISGGSDRYTLVLQGMEFAAVYFVTPSGAGKKNGATWADAMGLNEFKGMISNDVSGYTFYLAGGDYYISESEAGFSLSGRNETLQLSVYGGFNPASTGIDTEDRNTTLYPTVFSGNGEYGILNIGDKTDLYFDGIVFADGYSPASISSPKATAIFVNGSGQTGAQVEFHDCIFRDNVNESGTHKGGSALWVANGMVKCSGCLFTGNKGTTSVAAYTASASSTLWMYDCVIKDNVPISSGPHYGYVIKNLGTAIICNSTITGNRGNEGRKGALQDECAMVIVSSTVSETGNGSGEAGTVLRTTTSRDLGFVMNSIVLNSSASDGWCYLWVDSGSWKSNGYNILSSWMLSTSNQRYTSSDTDLSSSLATLGASFDSSENVFKWSGMADGITKCTAAQLKAELRMFSPSYNTNAGGVNFLEWIEGYGGVEKDQNGNVRDASAMWPGAYEKH